MRRFDLIVIADSQGQVQQPVGKERGEGESGDIVARIEARLRSVRACLYGEWRRRSGPRQHYVQYSYGIILLVSLLANVSSCCIA